MWSKYMKFRFFLIFTLALLIATVGFTGCEGDSDGTGTLNVKLIDAPLELENGLTVEEVNLTITRVDVVKKGSDAAEDESEESKADTEDEEIKDGDGVSTVFEGEKSFNLLDYSEESELNLGSLELEAGDYLQLRFVIMEESCTIKFADDDTQYDLTIPSGTSSGVKIKGNGNNPLFTI